MNFLRVVFTDPKAVARYLLWRLGVKRYQAQIPLFLIKRHVPPKPVILEAGAHMGEDSARLVQVLGPEKLYAFEPVPELFAALERRTNALAPVRCFPYALGDRIGTSTLHVSSGYHELPGQRIPADGSSSLVHASGMTVMSRSAWTRVATAHRTSASLNTSMSSSTTTTCLRNESDAKAAIAAWRVAPGWDRAMDT